MPSQELHITAATAPGSNTPPGSNITLNQEIDLLRVGLLYGDKVELCSPVTSLLVVMSEFVNLSGLARQHAFEELAHSLGNDNVLSVLQTYRQLPRRGLTPKQLIFKRQLEATINHAWSDLQKSMDDIFDKAGASGMKAALSSGLIELSIYPQDNTDEMLGAFFQSVTNAVTSGETYPLFDSTVGDLVDTAIKGGVIDVSQGSMQLGKVIALARDVFERLPTFDGATLDEILDIRRELAKPLIRFRGAVTEYARSIQSAQWDKDFASEANLTFTEKIAPAIADLEEQAKSARFMHFALRNVAAREITAPVPASILGVGLSTMEGFSHIVPLAAGLTVSTARAVYSAFDDWRAAQAKLQGNRLYFYYRLGRVLEAKKD